MIKVAMIGFGGIAQIHRYAYWTLNRHGIPVRLVAACDSDTSKFTTVTKTNLPLGDITDELPFNQYTDMDEMLQKEQPDMVDICLPTHLHKRITVKLLEAGYNVLCEKPMASTVEECDEMLAVAAKSGKELMIGQCLRYYPEYIYLQDIIEKGTYGVVKAANFFRFSPPPFWSGNADWRAASSKLGDCLMDLNIHDVDYIRWVWGEPKAVDCAHRTIYADNDTVHVEMVYDNVTATVDGGWETPQDVFRHGYTVEFENATVKMLTGRITVTQNGVEQAVDIQNYDGIIGEIAYFVEVLEGQHANVKNPPESSAETIHLLEKLQKISASK